MARGGKRTGAGRKKHTDPSVIIRVPVSQKKIIQNWIKNGDLLGSHQQTGGSAILESLNVLKDALTLKANAGGKIKTEIRRAIVLLKGGNHRL